VIKIAISMEFAIRFKKNDNLRENAYVKKNFQENFAKQELFLMVNWMATRNL
jgi:hypothetical protein